MADSLSSVFNLLDLRSARCTRFEAAGAWSLRFPAKPALKFAAVLRGGCWMLHGDRPSFRLEKGDTFLLSHTPAYVLASDPALAPLDGAAVIDWECSDTGRYGGADVVLIAGSFRISPLHQHLLTQALPHLLVIAREEPSAAGLSGTLQLMEREFAQTGMGSALMRHHLADMLLVQMLRAFAGRGSSPSDGTLPAAGSWIRALTDPRLAAALDAIHEAPERRWTVNALAARAGMSRTSFAEAFREAVGATPMDYVLGWRMQIAQDLLAQGESVAGIAAQLGYASQSAFGAAFKRVKGCSPKSAMRRVAAPA